MSYSVRKASWADFSEILRIYAYAREFMAANGNPSQWGRTYPPRRQLEADIADGKLYMVENEGKIHGVFYFAIEEDPAYRMIYEGDWISNTSYGTIHRVASDGSGGIFSACLSFCRECCGHIRIDTHRDNLVMQHLLEKAGFRHCGTIYIADGTDRLAYEWLLEGKPQTEN